MILIFYGQKKLNKNPLKTKENDFMRNLQFVKMLNLLLWGKMIKTGSINPGKWKKDYYI